MATTTPLYPTSATGSGLAGRTSSWHSPASATGAPDGTAAYNDDPTPGGRQQLVLTGYDPQAALLAATGGRVPYSVQYLQARVTFSIDDAASNYDNVSVLLLDSTGAPFASAPLYLLDAGDGLTVQGNVNFTSHNGYGNAPLAWSDLAGVGVAVQITRSGAAGVDTFRVEAVGLVVIYTLDAPTAGGQPTGGGGTGVTLRAYDRSGNRIATLPWSSLTRTVVRNAPGAITATVPRSLLDWNALPDEVYLRVAVNGVEAPDWYILNDDGDDDADTGGTARPVTIAGTGVAEMLAWGVVYSWQYDPDPNSVTVAIQHASVVLDNTYAAQQNAQRQLDALQATPNPSATDITNAQNALTAATTAYQAAVVDLQTALARRNTAGGHGNLLGLDPTHGFAGKTPGFILNELLVAAQARGCFPHLTWSFTGDVDSAGQGWPTVYSRTYDLGIDLQKVLTGMSDDGWVDWEMSGFRLDVYVPDSHLAVDQPNLVLRLGKGVNQAPRKRTRKTARSTILANGAQGATVEVSDADALARWGRREGYEGRSGVTDYGTLTAATQTSLARQTTASEAITLALDPFAMPVETPALPRPGGYLRYDQRRLSASQLEPLRVQSIAWDYGPDTPVVSVELNDMWVDADIRRGRQLDAILNGSSANERVPQSDPSDDKLAPATPQGLAVTSSAYLMQGQTQAQMTASWQQVTTNSDGTVISDLAGYDLEWQQTAVMPGLHSMSMPVKTLVSWSPVIPNEMIQVHIRAVDRWGNTSPWSDWLWAKAGVDTTPPPAPSKPVLDNYLGLLRVQWDGGTADGSAMPPDLDRVEVHVSQTPNFTIGKTTLVGPMTAPGSLFVEVADNALSYAKLIAYDHTGNVSAASPEVSGKSEPVVAASVFDGAVGSSKLADLAVLTAKINDLAVNTAKIGSMDVGKLTAGILSAQVTLSGRIATALTGKRTEMNAQGFYRWDGVNSSPVVAIDDSGVLLTGVIRTAVSGRRIELGASGNYGQLDFWAPGQGTGSLASRSFLRSYTEGSGLEAIQIGVGDPTLNGLDNRININTNSYATFRFANIDMVYGNRMAFFSSAYSSGTGVLQLNADRSVAYFTNSYSIFNAANTAQMFSVSSSGQLDHYGSSAAAVQHFYADGSCSFETTSNGKIQIGTHTFGSGVSPVLRFYSGNNYGGAIHFSQEAAGQFIDFTDWSLANWLTVRGTSFLNQSDARSKQQITALAGAERRGLLEQVRVTPVSRYRRLGPAGPSEEDPDTEATSATVAAHATARRKRGREEIGLIAQQAPAQIVHGEEDSRGGLFIDSYQMASMMWGALGELADQVDQLRAQLAETKGPAT